MHEYGTLKSAKAILKRGGQKGRILERKNQTGVHCTLIWKCHNKTPYTTNIY
jgi:hypothetical protein